MSQKSVPQRPVQPRVASGVPWWLWVLLCIVGGGTAVSWLLSSLPEDPEQLYQSALTALDEKNTEQLRENHERLKKFPEYGRQQKMLEGILLLGGSRPLKAIPLLKEAAGEENDANQELRQTALRFLGGAYAVAHDQKMAIRTFELMLQEDENSDIARQSLVSLLHEILAWEESLTHLNFLAERKFNLPQILTMRGDIRLEQRQYEEAAKDFEAAIMANEADPLNSSKITKLVDCLIQLRNFDKADTFVDQVDHPGKKAIARAEVLLSKEDLTGAIAALEMVRREAPNDPDAASIYGRIMLKHNTPERAAEGLVSLRTAVMTATRDVKLYRLIVELAKLAGDTELAGLAQQNVELLDAMNAELDQKFSEVIRTRDDPELRLQLAELAHKCGNFDLALKSYSGLLNFYPDRATEISAKREQMMNPLPQLVSTATGAGNDGAVATPTTNEATIPENVN